MNKQSIDGLVNRSTASGERAKPVATRRQAVRKTAQKAKTERKISIQAPKETKSKKEEEQDKAVKEFLEISKDPDPTSIDSIKDEPRSSKKDKKRARKEKKGKKRHHIFRWIVILFVLAIIGGVVWLYLYGNNIVSNISGGNLWNVLTADPDVPLATDSVSGRTNILLFGTEGYSMDNSSYAGSKLTDSMMIVSLDQNSGDIRTVNLPRDLKYDKGACTGTRKLNEIYYCTYSRMSKKTAEEKKKAEDAAAKKLMAAAEDILGIKIQYYAHANWRGVEKAIDALGGIDVVFVYGNQKWEGDETTIETSSPKGLKDAGYNEKTHSCTYPVDYKNGVPYHLNGKQALRVARSRNANYFCRQAIYGASNSNFNREIFQQRIIQATLKKAKNTNYVTDFNAALGVVNAIGDNIRTSVKDTEYKTIFKLIPSINTDEFKSLSLVNTKNGSLFTTGTINKISYVLPRAGDGNFTQIRDYVKKNLNVKIEEPESETDEGTEKKAE